MTTDDRTEGEGAVVHAKDAVVAQTCDECGASCRCEFDGPLMLSSGCCVHGEKDCDRPEGKAEPEGLVEYLEQTYGRWVPDTVRRKAAALAAERDKWLAEHEIAARNHMDAEARAERLEEALRILTAFARTAPGRLPAKVQEIVDTVQWENPQRALADQEPPRE